MARGLFCFLGFCQRKKFEDGEIHLGEHEDLQAPAHTSLSRQYSVSATDVLSVELRRHKRWLLPTYRDRIKL